MAYEVLQFVALTSGGRAFDISFPLHPQTQSATAVSDLVTQLLAAISEHTKGRKDVSDGDILQALAMTSAIRGRMLEGDQAQIADLNRFLNEQAWEAVSSASSYAAARA
jgi:2C-methyl-D-erythritol 2,4-cyclodiphosphate synthase